MRFRPAPDVCPLGRFSVRVGPVRSPLTGVLTFAGSGTAIRAITFAIGQGLMERWRVRLERAGVRILGRAWQFDETHLCFVDEFDFDLALVEIVDNSAWYPEDDPQTILGFRGIEIAADPGAELETLFAALDIRPTREEHPLSRFDFAWNGSTFSLDLLRQRSEPARPDPARAAALTPPQRIGFLMSDRVALDRARLGLDTAGFELASVPGEAGAFRVRLRSCRDLEIGFHGT